VQQFEVEVNGRVRQVTIQRVAGGYRVTVDGRSRTIDVAQADAHTLSLLVGGEEGAPRTEPSSSAPAGSGGRSHEVTLAPDAASGRTTVQIGAAPLAAALNGRRRRFGRKDDGGGSGSGPHRVVAPMPGKVVRVLVRPGESVRARQAVAVIEAMKMENELRAGRDGTVAEVQVRDGQSVEAGALVAVITGGTK
jgi:biotin carboxyl carrier protein